MEENRTGSLYPDVCVCCGKPVPEGRMVCFVCETGGATVVPNNTDRPRKGLRKIIDFAKEHKNGSQA